MNPIEGHAAEVFFAELLLPLRRANLRRGVDYLDGLERGVSHWGRVVSRTGGIERLLGAACDPDHLLEQLGNYWRGRNEPHLEELLPYLRALRQSLLDSSPADPHSERAPTEFVYPLY
jgi:hypothetical protein